MDEIKEQTEIVGYTFRMPRFLLDKLREEASATDRSMNSMFVRALKERYGINGADERDEVAA